MLRIHIVTQTNSNTDTDTDIYTYIYIYLHTHIYIYIYIYMSLTIPIVSKHYTEANKSIIGWLNSLLVSIQNYILCYIYVKYTQVL